MVPVPHFFSIGIEKEISVLIVDCSATFVGDHLPVVEGHRCAVAEIKASILAKIPPVCFFLGIGGVA